MRIRRLSRLQQHSAAARRVDVTALAVATESIYIPWKEQTVRDQSFDEEASEDAFLPASVAIRYFTYFSVSSFVQVSLFEFQISTPPSFPLPSPALTEEPPCQCPELLLHPVLSAYPRPAGHGAVFDALTTCKYLPRAPTTRQLQITTYL